MKRQVTRQIICYKRELVPERRELAYVYDRPRRRKERLLTFVPLSKNPPLRDILHISACDEIFEPAHLVISENSYVNKNGQVFCCFAALTRRRKVAWFEIQGVPSKQAQHAWEELLAGKEWWQISGIAAVEALRQTIRCRLEDWYGYEPGAQPTK